MPISRGVLVYSAVSITTVEMESDDKVYVQEGTEIKVEAIFNKRDPGTRRFIGTCIASEECKEDVRPPSISSRCTFDIGGVRFDAPTAPPIAKNTAAQWGSSRLVCTVTTIII
jgi:hypothetical protein